VRHSTRLSSFRPRLLDAGWEVFRNPCPAPFPKSLDLWARDTGFRAFRKELFSVTRQYDHEQWSPGPHRRSRTQRGTVGHHIPCRSESRVWLCGRSHCFRIGEHSPRKTPLVPQNAVLGHLGDILLSSTLWLRTYLWDLWFGDDTSRTIAVPKHGLLTRGEVRPRHQLPDGQRIIGKQRLIVEPWFQGAADDLCGLKPRSRRSRNRLLTRLTAPRHVSSIETSDLAWQIPVYGTEARRPRGTPVQKWEDCFRVSHRPSAHP
jgi:hypothetical protein